MEQILELFKNYLDKQGKDYIDFIIDVMNENREDVAFQDIPMAPMDSNKVISDDIVTVSDAMNEKRKSFFGRLFS